MKTIGGIKFVDCRFAGSYGSALNYSLDRIGVKHIDYSKGALLEMFRRENIPCVDGKYLGRDVYDIIKKEYDRAIAKSKNSKANNEQKRTEASSTPEPYTSASNNFCMPISDAVELSMLLHDTARNLSRLFQILERRFGRCD